MRSESLISKARTISWQKACRHALGRAGGPAAVLLVAAQAASAAPITVNPADSVQQQNQTLLNDITRKSTTKQQGPVVISPAQTRAAQVAPGGATVLLRKVEFAPASAFLTQADLDGILANYLGKRVDFSQIQHLVQQVNDLYNKRGVVTASAVLPPQTLSDGVLKVQLVEGKLAKVVVNGDHQTADKFVLGRVRLTTAGDVVDVPTAARDLTWFNKVYHAQLRMSLQPGAVFGTTDVALAISEPKKNQLSFFIDNQGVSSTGRGEAGAYYHAYGLAGIDDNLLVFGTASGGSISGSISYDLPVSTSGTRLTFAYNRSGIAVVNGATKALDVKGRSQAISTTLSQPFLANTKWALLGLSTLSYGTSYSRSQSVPLVNSTTSKISLGLSAAYSGEAGSFTIQPQAVYARSDDKLGGSTRNIWLGTGTVSGGYRFGDGWSFVGNGAWQFGGEKLLPGDLLFQIGGPTTVRGYPADAAAGDGGYFAQFELHKTLDAAVKGMDGYGFIDAGEVYSTFPTSTFLISAGAGVSFPLTEKAGVQLGVGFPLRQAVSNQSSATLYVRLTYLAF